VLEEIAREKGLRRDEIEVWYADQARVGQKNKRTRRWARRGTRPAAPHDHRTASTYIFGVICPMEGKAAGLILPHCDTEPMSLHLTEITTTVAPSKHAMLVLDRADWHLSGQLVIPPNITPVPLPPKCPEPPRQCLEAGGKCLAVDARELALEPGVPLLQRHRRPLLPRLEQARRSALAHHVHRIAPVGS
jgi:hypothetical protein